MLNFSVIFSLSFLQLQLYTVLINGASFLDPSTCWSTKGCLQSPWKCSTNSSTENCVYFLSYGNENNKNNDSVEFELQFIPNVVGFVPASVPVWTAIGFSKNGAMASSAATVCVFNTENSTVSLWLTFNYGTTNKRIQRTELEAPTVQLLDASSIDGAYFCRFRQLVYPVSDPEIFSLDSAFYILVAGGTATISDWSAQEITLNGHSLDYTDPQFPLCSEEQVLLSQQAAVFESEHHEAPSTIIAIGLVRSHAILMILGWWLFVPSGILFARYCKNLWPKRKILGKPVWFGLHQIVQRLAILFIFPGFVCIVVRVTTFPISIDLGDTLTALHIITGYGAFICAIIQPVLAMLRCSLGTRRRPLFNWVHRCLGVGGFLLSCMAIGSATHFPQYGLNSAHFGQLSIGLMSFYWLFCFVTVLCLEIICRPILGHIMTKGQKVNHEPAPAILTLDVPRRPRKFVTEQTNLSLETKVQLSILIAFLTCSAVVGIVMSALLIAV